MIDKFKWGYYMVFITLVAVTYSCERKIENEKENEERRYDDTKIQYRSDSLSLRFDYVLQAKKIELFYIRSGKEVIVPHRHLNLSPREMKSLTKDIFRFKRIDDLQTYDTLQLRGDDKVLYTITNFRNGPKYGGRRYLGCALYECAVNEVVNYFEGSVHLNIKK